MRIVPPHVKLSVGNHQQVRNKHLQSELYMLGINESQIVNKMFEMKTRALSN